MRSSALISSVPCQYVFYASRASSMLWIGRLYPGFDDLNAKYCCYAMISDKGSSELHI